MKTFSIAQLLDRLSRTVRTSSSYTRNSAHLGRESSIRAMAVTQWTQQLVPVLMTRSDILH